MQAPEGRLEVRALWAWLQLQLALSLLAFHHLKNTADVSPTSLTGGPAVAVTNSGEPGGGRAGGEVVGGGPPGGEVAGDGPAGGEVEGGGPPGGEVAGDGPAGGEVAGDGHAIYGHVDGLLEAMQFWMLFEEVIEAGKPKAACALLQQTFARLTHAGLLRYGMVS
jgi:hypothetical protein